MFKDLRIKPFKITLAELYFNPGSQYLELKAQITPQKEEKEDEKVPKGKGGGKKKKKGEEEKPQDELQLLRSEILKKIPVGGEGGKDKGGKGGKGGKRGGGKGGGGEEWVPHLTLGQFSQSEIKEVRFISFFFFFGPSPFSFAFSFSPPPSKNRDKIQSQWEPLDFLVKEIVILWKDRGRPYKIDTRIPLLPLEE